MTDYEDALAQMEQHAEERAPGVLDLLDTYGRTISRPPAWRPVNAGTITYATGTARRAEP